MLGVKVRAARKARGWSLGDTIEVLREAGGPELAPGTLARMEDGSRPGSPEAWGFLWQVLRLPLRDLYEGLGLPVPTELPDGTAGEIQELVTVMPEEARRLVLSFVRHAPAMLEAAGVRPLSLAKAGGVDQNETDIGETSVAPRTSQSSEGTPAPWDRREQQKRSGERDKRAAAPDGDGGK